MAQADQPGQCAGLVLWGFICTGEVYRDKVKVTFAEVALLDDQASLFHASLDDTTQPAFDIGKDAGDRKGSV